MLPELIYIAAAFAVLGAVALLIDGITTRQKRKRYRRLVYERACRICKKRGTMECPDTFECMAASGKPEFEAISLRAATEQELLK